MWKSMLLYKSSLMKTKTTLRSGQRLQPQGLDRFGKNWKQFFSGKPVRWAGKRTLKTT